MGQLHDITVDDYLERSVRIEPLAIQEEYIQLPADIAYWNARYAEALRAHLRAKIECDQVEARLSIEHRERLTSSNAKVTVDMVESAVKRDEAMRDAHLASIEAEVEKARLQGVLDAVRSKRDMLISLGAHVRAEMQHDPRVRDEQSTATGRLR